MKLDFLKNTLPYIVLRKFYKKYYYKNVNFKKNPIYKISDFPREIWLENTNHCNAACIMCPRELQTRKKGLMKMELYKKLINEMSFHKNTVERLHMHNFGEPLLDKKLPERIKIAKDNGIKHVYFVSNASLLTPKITESLILSGLDQFKISFYGIDKESYNNTMIDLDYETTLSNVKNFFEIRKKLNAKNPSVVIQLIPQLLKKGQVEKWYEQFKHLLDYEIGDSIIEVPIHNFSDGRKYNNINQMITDICPYPWRTMVILQDGQVSPCSHDFNGSIDLGDVNFLTISEVWNGEKYKKIRKSFKNLNYSNYSACNKCDVPRNAPALEHN